MRVSIAATFAAGFRVRVRVRVRIQGLGLGLGLELACSGGLASSCGSTTSSQPLASRLSPPPAAPIIQRIAAAIPGAEATQLAGAGHMAPITHTADAGDAISGFLKRSAA